MNPSLTIERALIDRRLLGTALGDIHTWQTWRTVLKAAFGLGLNREEAPAFASVAGSRTPPAQRVRELWCIIGRRGGKSKMAAAIAVYLAVFVQHRLSPGERGLVLCLAASTEQARVVFGYAKAFLTGRPLELPPAGGCNWYQAFTDPSGGVGADSYTLAIGHREDSGVLVVDVVRGTSGKFDPYLVTAEYATLCREYGIDSVTGDVYAAQWVAGAWQEQNIAYLKSDLPKSQIYLECLPLFARGLVRLPDHLKLLRELRLLERHSHRSGRDTVDHARGGHDDHANAVCGVLRNLSNYLGYDLTMKWIDGVGINIGGNFRR